MIITMISGLTQQLESLEQKYIMLYKRLQTEEKFPKERAGMLTFKLVIYSVVVEQKFYHLLEQKWY